jgi:radical SAM superfamily enzyme YgiQ (UPF0313 family)
MRFHLIDLQGINEICLTKGVDIISSKYCPPLGLLYIGRSLEDEGHKVEITQFSNEDSSTMEYINKSLSSFDAIGISVTSSSYQDAAVLVNKIKEKDNSIPIIIGGPHCTHHPKKSLSDIPKADISIEGDGELIIKDVASALEGTKKLTGLPGVHHRYKNKIKSGKSSVPIKDLNSLPFPARHLVDKYDYGKINDIYLFKPKLTSIITSRGCPYNCSFCSRNALTYKTYRERSPENVVNELQEINDKYNSVYIVDDNFLTNKKRAHKIFDLLLENPLDIDLLIMGARVDSAERELYKKMKKAGVKYIEFGIESGNQDVLNFYNKRTTIEDIRYAVNLSREMDFFILGNFIIGAPIETEHHIEQTIKFACDLPLDSAVFFPLGYMYGSDLWNEALQNDIINDNDGYGFTVDSKKGIGNFTKMEVYNFCQEAMKRFYLRPKFFVQEFYRSLLRKDFRFLKIGLKYLL